MNEAEPDCQTPAAIVNAVEIFTSEPHGKISAHLASEKTVN